MQPPDELVRCAWALGTPEYVTYHDTEWGRALHGDREMFERVSLEAFQSGLSWITILRKREAFRSAFHGFHPDAVAASARPTWSGCSRTPGSSATAPRSRRPCRTPARCSTSTAASASWSGPSRPTATAPRPATLAEVPAVTPESKALAKALKQRGFRFVGPTTAYALMQATGMVNDHIADCHVRAVSGPTARTPGERPRRGRELPH